VIDKHKGCGMQSMDYTETNIIGREYLAWVNIFMENTTACCLAISMIHRCAAGSCIPCNRNAYSTMHFERVVELSVHSYLYQIIWCRSKSAVVVVPWDGC
jgi:hypothetical protein